MRGEVAKLKKENEDLRASLQKFVDIAIEDVVAGVRFAKSVQKDPKNPLSKMSKYLLAMVNGFTKS